MPIKEAFFEVVRDRRSIRKFKPDPVPDEYIERIIEAARWAQSGANAQPWEFIIIKDNETKSKIVSIYEKHREQQWDIEKTRVKELRHLSYTDGPPSGPAGFKDAPVFIIVCGDPRTIQATVLVAHFLSGEGGPGAHFLKALANATQIMHLATTALGLGSQWVSLNKVTEAHLKALLGVPEEFDIHTIVPVGYPSYEPSPPYRRELKEIVHYEKYDQSKFRSGDDIFEYLLALRQHTKPSYKI